MLGLKVILSAAFVVSASQAGSQDIPSSDAARAALKECYLSNIVELGKGNQEPAATLLSAIETICEDHYTTLGFSYLREESPIMREARARDLREIRSAATVALIRSRSSS